MKRVLKFGGSSVANADSMKRTMDIVMKRMHRGRAVVVVSALGGVTDALLNCGDMAADGAEKATGSAVEMPAQLSSLMAKPKYALMDRPRARGVRGCVAGFAVTPAYIFM